MCSGLTARDPTSYMLGVSQLSNQHLNSLAHALVYECDKCDRPFGSLNSSAHAPVMSATTVIVHSEASKLSTNTLALLLMLRRTSVMSATGRAGI